MRAWGQQRIDYLAAVRNEAIAPLTSPALCEAALTRVAPAAAPPSPRLLRDAKGRSSGSSNGSSSGKGSSSSIKGSSGSSAAGRRAGAGSRGARGVRSSDSSSGNGSVTKSTNGTNGTRSEACATGFPATKVLFLNDVYFCWQVRCCAECSLVSTRRLCCFVVLPGICQLVCDCLCGPGHRMW